MKTPKLIPKLIPKSDDTTMCYCRILENGIVQSFVASCWHKRLVDYLEQSYGSDKRVELLFSGVHKQKDVEDIEQLSRPICVYRGEGRWELME